MKKTLLLLFFFPLSVSLFAQATQDSSKAVRRNFEVKEPLDKDRYIHLKEDFYTDQEGRLYMRLLAVCSGRCEPGTFEAVYVQTMPLRDVEEYDTLKNFIDIATYQSLPNSQYSKDKNRVYVFFANSCGGNLHMLTGADPASIDTIFDYRWARDKNKLFYEGGEVKGCNPEKVKVIYPDNGSLKYEPAYVAFFIDYITDGKNIWYGYTKLEGVDSETFHLVIDNNQYDAEDKNHKYQMGYKIKEDR